MCMPYMWLLSSFGRREEGTLCVSTEKEAKMKGRVVLLFDAILEYSLEYEIQSFYVLYSITRTNNLVYFVPMRVLYNYCTTL